MKKIISFLITLLLLLTSSDLFAHKMKTAFTIVLFNERTNNIEIMHRFYLHDAEEAVWELIDSKADIIGSEKTQVQFTLYVEHLFEIKNQDNETLPLELLGYQNDDGYFWIYQETPIPDNLKGLHIKHEALQDIWSEQINVLNVEGLGEVITLQFDKDKEWHYFKLPTENAKDHSPQK